MEVKAVTTKTGYSSERVIPVERVHRVIRAKNATEKWKENIYFEREEELTPEEREAVASAPVRDESKSISAQELYEMEMAKYNPVREKLMGKSR